MLIWFFIGVALILLELATPLFILIFFGIGAWAAALMSIIYPGTEQEIVTFIIVSLISLIVLRKKMLKIFQGKQSKKNITTLTFPHIGRQAEVIEDISPKYEGQVSVGGSYWRATATTFIPKGDRVTVLACAENDEILLIVEPIL